MKALVRSGAGFNAVQSRGKMVEVVSEVQQERLATHLTIGDVVFRWLRKGDCVIVNRQPTLHRLGILAHRVVPMPWSTIRLPEKNTTSYNADFDGDEMNIHSPQTLQACVELQELANVEHNMISPNSHPTIGFIQNSLLGIYLLTQKHVLVTRDNAMQLLSWHGSDTRNPHIKPLPPFAVWSKHKGPFW